MPDTPAAGSAASVRVTPTWLRRYATALVASDFCLSLLAAAAGVATRFGSHIPPGYIATTLAFPVLYVACMFLQRAYEPRFLGSGTDEYRRVFDGGVRLSALAVAIAFGLKLDLARGFLIVALPLAIALTLIGRYQARRILFRLRLNGRCLHRVVVAGRERSVAELIRHIRSDVMSGFAVVGVCLDHADPRKSAVEGVPILGDNQSILHAVRDADADTLAVTAWSDISQAGLRELSWDLEGSGVAILVAPRLTDVAGPRIHIRPVARLPLLHIEEPEFTGGRRFAKTVIDRVGGLVLLVLLLPLFAFVMLVIRLSSRGPAIFRQARVGVRGEVFTVYKFRTMVVGAEDLQDDLDHLNDHADGLLFKIKADPRTTAVGRVLRRFSLDELPQLFNIIKGDMSMVGPRPPLPGEVAAYPKAVKRRLLVKPGITGLWQVSGRSDLSWEESVRLDLDYVENWSLSTDMVIIWRTLSAVLARRGAY